MACLNTADTKKWMHHFLDTFDPYLIIQTRDIYLFTRVMIQHAKVVMIFKKGQNYLENI